ncbi:hypothetical protein ESY86_05175 [Subsaximicrobium wynnwilliamsii]|uniref:Uncharacterized protein n=1 Tax=Subsaximicrobium wynnwilliamsii TaxID=291179 RepID=A0A5C6ZLM6_9FLAO|nr:hypothetical protein [Subsaximicrobium wynnwilliamsii]TXD84460.1 hypothetical protein ESY87_04955 [Subsaximicrobium wynnwilliamsii]TXD90141.1 hypothetical protein ESY86_05175 [Subsaximicrobium wynnwilliamsii]TXE04193.1 hypothetical protein ESY88_04950 [Subsaximicrobium wynnwilliamsii]
MRSANYNIKEKQIYFKVYQDLPQLENALKHLEEQRFLQVQVSVLGKSEQFHVDKNTAISKDTDTIKTYWESRLGNTMNFGTFYNPQTGSVFIVGSLVSTFLHKINGKSLATLSSGPYGVFRGIGASEAQATHCLKQLNDGNYVLILRGFEQELQAFDALSCRPIDK